METNLQNEPPEVAPTRESLPVTVASDTPNGSLVSTSKSPPPASKEGPAERIFGGYELLGEIAAGGMGIVYEARDRVLNRSVALKVLRYGAVASESQKLRFFREAQAAAQLNHPHIVPIHEIAEHDGQPFFTMALCVGGSLTGHLAAYQADLRAAVTLVEKVARAVHYAHGKGVLHRDLKPSNILIDERGEPQVSDFGIAKLAGAELELTAPGVMLGTPLYMSPEQAGAEGTPVTAQSDVWSLGVMLYELLTGKRPFQARDTDEVYRRIRHDEPTAPNRLRSPLDRNLERVVLKCFEKSPAQRYASAEALADDLKRWLAGEPVLARPELGRCAPGGGFALIR